MPHKDPEAAKAWRRKWWKTATKARQDQNTAARERRNAINAFLREHKLAAGCADCKYRKHHSALEFHHTTGKKDINLSFAKSLAQAQAEAAKCIVLCANCHRIRHWNEKHPEDPCKPDIFAATYEPAPSAAPRPGSEEAKKTESCRCGRPTWRDSHQWEEGKP